MKKTVLHIIFPLLILGCAEPPLQFSEDALAEEMIALNGNAINLSEVLEMHQGKTVLIDVWASWCGDCIKGMPTVKDLQEQFPEVNFVFLSVDRNQASWKRGIQRYNVNGEHYFLSNGQKGAFGDFLNSNWIPRYMVIDKKGNIKLFKAKKATDERIIKALK